MRNSIAAIEALIEIQKGQMTVEEIYQKFSRTKIIQKLEPILIERFANKNDEYFKLTFKGERILNTFCDHINVITDI
jgi:predicted transcriptional regulator